MPDKILYIKPANSTFMITDQQIMEKNFRVKSFVIAGGKGGIRFIRRIIAMIFFVINHIRDTKAIVTWFADYHAAVLVFMGKVFNMKVIIIAGGQEAICYPELRKGVYLKKFRGNMVKYALRNASLIIPNHESLIYHENFFYDPRGKKDGMKYYIPDLETPIDIVYNGIDPSKFYRDDSISKEPGAIMTLGTMNTTYDFINKGFDLFIDLARRNPGLHFCLIGINRNFLPWIEKNHPYADLPNLEVVFSFCTHEIIFKNLNKAKVFIQASITEGMPNTLCEAMLCECIPVGSAVNGIPDVIGETGIIIKKRNIEALEQAVYQALKFDTGKMAADRIRENFSMGQREKKITEILFRELGD
ncbi:MAG: glycosyltransferase family 4 protein [Syntrophothermus sp.]